MKLQLTNMVDTLCKQHGIDVESIVPKQYSNVITVSDILETLKQKFKEISNLHISEQCIRDFFDKQCTSRVWQYSLDSNVVCKKLVPKSSTQLRKYQADAVHSILDDHSAKSGTIKLPCGAGKTMILSYTLAELETTALILSTSNVSCLQWYQHLMEYYHIKKQDIVVIGEDMKNIGSKWFTDPPAVVISTYNMLTSLSTHSEEVENKIKFIKTIVFGVIICDEAQTTPANTFQNFTNINHKIRLGASATFMREDDGINRFDDIIGPRLYDIDRQTLVSDGFLSDVKRIELHLPIPKCSLKHKKQSEKYFDIITHDLKMQTLRHLITWHRHNKDKIIVFCDDIKSLKYIYNIMENEFEDCYGPIYMETNDENRMKAIAEFKANGGIIFFSKVGDAAIDMPDANILIQMSILTKSKNQEGQRLGRIQRKPDKQGDSTQAISFAYNLVSKGTEEEANVEERRIYTTSEGYVTITYTPETCTTSEFEPISTLQLPLGGSDKNKKQKT